MKSVRATMTAAKYTVVGETLRHVIPSHMQCSFGCGGQACKYEDPSHWSEAQQAIRGLYSSWINENLLAMARPSTEIIKKYDVIEQFQRCGLRTIINLQRPGEHADCGKPLEPESGFSYRPEVFMEAGIYFYNFGWSDYNVASLTAILDMVKVMSFALQEGKIAIHCHAGLGRTGVLLACFLLFTSRMSADQAILFVRSKRPNSIQTRGQLRCVAKFAKFLVPLRNVFAHAEPRASPVTLSDFLIRQKHILHGYEARQLRHVPKLVPLICKLLLDVAENRQVIEEDVLEVLDITSDDESSVSHSVRPPPEFSRNIMVGGVTFNLPQLPGPFTIAKNDSQLPLHYARKSLSYSDSDLRRLADMMNLSTSSRMPSQASVHGNLSTYGSCGSLWDLKKWVKQNEECPVLSTRRQSVLQRTQSLGVSRQMETKRSFSMLRLWKNEANQKDDSDTAKSSQINNKGDNEEEEERLSEVPFITIQSELTLEARRLLVAHSLAVNLNQDGKEEHKVKVSDWQMELNHQGAFEHLCLLERDPFVLAGILWSWLEQLKEPVLSLQDVQMLKQQNPDPKTVLNSLERAQRETLVCILDCFAHLLVVPEEVEEAFVQRVIKAFTAMENVGDGREVYGTITDVLKRVLRDMRRKAMDDLETPQ